MGCIFSDFSQNLELDDYRLQNLLSLELKNF